MEARMILKKIYLILTFTVLTNIGTGHAEVKAATEYENYNIPSSVRSIIDSGYGDIEIKKINNYEYLVVTSESDINKCSILFKINNGSVESVPSIGINESICNISIDTDKLISSWRDQGRWNEDIYKINPDDKWVLLFKDSCIGCGQVKRIYFNSDGTYEKLLLSDGDNLSLRKKLIGKVTIEKAKLYNNANDNSISNAYLIKGDIFFLVDISDDGEFIQIKYKTSTGRYIIKWMKKNEILISKE